MDESTITQYILETFDGVQVVEAWGDTFFYYNPDRALPDEFYFATLKSQDDDYDNVSDLSRPSVFRLNLGIGKTSFDGLFGPLPKQRASESTAESDVAGDEASRYDYTALDTLMPHPVYGQAFWVCVLNPSAATFETVKPLLAEAYERAVNKYTKKAARD